MLLRKFTKYIFLIIFISSNAFAINVLIDPGHGGEETGAIGYYNDGKKKVKVYEKDISLALSKELKKQLDNTFSTYLTRSIDRTVSLDERAQLADKIKADLVISIHFNSYKKHNTGGFETYYLDNHKDSAVEKVEKIENKNLQGEELVINQILIDLVVQKTVKTSRRLASMVHTNLKRNVQKEFKIKDRKVRPGLFYILALSKRPGILVEGGFVSNPRELRKIISKDYQVAYAKSIADAIKKYFKK